MALPSASKTAMSISALYVILADLAASGDTLASQTGRYQIKVAYSDGTVGNVTGDLVPHITVAQRNALLNFMTSLRAQAEEQMLNGG
jgi:hypothetical protein